MFRQNVVMIRLYMLGNNPMSVWRMVFLGTGPEIGKLLGGYCNSPGKCCCWYLLVVTIGIERREWTNELFKRRNLQRSGVI